jgi:hypothetical protein
MAFLGIGDGCIHKGGLISSHTFYHTVLNAVQVQAKARGSEQLGFKPIAKLETLPWMPSRSEGADVVGSLIPAHQSSTSDNTVLSRYDVNL